MSGVQSYLEPQLPISRTYEGMAWCKTITKPNETRWLWGLQDNGLSIAVYKGAYGDETRVSIMTGLDGGALATGCE